MCFSLCELGRVRQWQKEHYDGRPEYKFEDVDVVKYRQIDFYFVFYYIIEVLMALIPIFHLGSDATILWDLWLGEPWSDIRGRSTTEFHAIAIVYTASVVFTMVLEVFFWVVRAAPVIKSGKISKSAVISEARSYHVLRSYSRYCIYGRAEAWSVLGGRGKLLMWLVPQVRQWPRLLLGTVPQTIVIWWMWLLDLYYDHDEILTFKLLLLVYSIAWWMLVACSFPCIKLMILGSVVEYTTHRYETGLRTILEGPGQEAEVYHQV